MRIANTVKKSSGLSPVTAGYIAPTKARPMVPFAHAKRTGSGERYFNSAGELNASSDVDVMAQIASILADHANGKIATTANEEARVDVAKQRQMVTAAYEDKKSSAFSEIGAEMGDVLKEVIDRDGFMRRLLVQLDVAQGQFPRHRVLTKDVNAVVAPDVGTVESIWVRDKYIMPPEFPIAARLMVSSVDLVQSTGDLLTEKYNEGLEAIMVGEDRTLKDILDATVGVYNQLQYTTGGLTPAILSSMISQMTTWGVPAQSLLIAADYWDDMRANTSFAAYYDPVTKRELIENGVLGRFFGLDYITDGLRHPALKVLNPGELYVLAQPQYLGAYTERGPVESTEIDGAIIGQIGRGWMFQEIISMAVHNARGVVAGRRS